MCGKQQRRDARKLEEEFINGSSTKKNSGACGTRVLDDRPLASEVGDRYEGDG
jgi:hypothetical protein